jgi:hypothetical protein
MLAKAREQERSESKACLEKASMSHKNEVICEGICHSLPNPELAFHLHIG